MSIKNLVDTIKIKVAEISAKDLSKKAERGDLGGFLQRAYIATKGYKTAIGAALFLIVQALGQFSPPGSESYLRSLSIASGVLFAIGLLDKARRNEPFFEPWFLEALAKVSAWIGSLSAIALGAVQGGLLDLIFPGDLVLVDQVTLITTALTTATAFVNRLAKASASNPKPVDPAS